MKYIKEKLASMLDLYLTESDKMDEQGSYNEIIKELPQVKTIWEKHRQEIEESRLLFEYRITKIIEKLPEVERG